ncbi:MAG TPA: CHAD domain-containing protein [Pyrinomonadaceae bacterium]|nr:CHAD domain-containing protein [Pyrinomonadaceae bacterium]
MPKANIRGLDCAAPADKMIPLVLRAQLNAMCRHRELALNWKDPEGVHHMRVLSRRLRSSINDFRPYFRKPDLPRAKLRAVASRLGEVRDIDVALMSLQQLRAKTKGPASDGIKLLATELRARRKIVRTILTTTLQEQALEDVRKEFIAKLRTLPIVVPKEVPAEPAAPAVARSFGSLGTEIVNARVKDFVAASSCLYQPHQIKKLHELRILAKRLRYSMELFALCWGKEWEAMAKEVAHMQTSLGELHDCDVWIQDLGARLKRRSRKTPVAAIDLQIRAGASWLFKHFAAARNEHYRDAVSRWEQWQAEGFLEQIAAKANGQSAEIRGQNDV